LTRRGGPIAGCTGCWNGVEWKFSEACGTTTTTAAFFFFWISPCLRVGKILGEEGGLLLSFLFLGGITVRGRGYCREKIEPSREAVHFRRAFRDARIRYADIKKKNERAQAKGAAVHTVCIFIYSCFSSCGGSLRSRFKCGLAISLLCSSIHRSIYPIGSLFVQMKKTTCYAALLRPTTAGPRPLQV
jgi:hypothetical protein